ncbi:quinone oxidoreductase family protein [Aquipuribacter nitratireducens]|uniref:Zinc-binding alcohol dehydrogenase family protein n=1 Tax=Aquipuribacter nitratireducens TaxID=650104 RepID=A0ABW0GNI5_9MICO
MDALVLESHGGPPVPRTLPDPSPGAGRTLVAVRAAALAPLDVLAGSGASYLGAPALPYVPGVAGVGRVVASGAHPVGARVHVTTSAGLAPGDGTFAGLVVVPDDVCVLLGDEVTDDAAVAALGMSAVAAWHALAVRGRLAAGQRVLVLGAGGTVGQVAVQVARHLVGATGRVVAAARSAGARAAALGLGADEALDVTAEALAAGSGWDVVLDPLGGPPATAALLGLAVGGRFVHLGSSAGPSFEVSSAALRGRAAEVLGHTNALLTGAEIGTALTSALAVPGVRVAHETVPLEQGGDAWRRQAEGRAPRRQVLVLP